MARPILWAGVTQRVIMIDLTGRRVSDASGPQSWQRSNAPQGFLSAHPQCPGTSLDASLIVTFQLYTVGLRPKLAHPCLPARSHLYPRLVLAPPGPLFSPPLPSISEATILLKGLVDGATGELIWHGITSFPFPHPPCRFTLNVMCVSEGEPGTHFVHVTLAKKAREPGSF